MPKYKKLFDQDYEVIHMHCARTASHFMDDKFPPADSSLWRAGTDNHHEPVEWKRVKELTSDPHLFVFNGKKLNPDIVQGEVGNCWLVSALSVLSAHPHLLQKVVPHWSMQDWNHSDEPGRKLGVYNFRDTERHPGVFRFRFYRFGEWVEVVVDDYLPTRNGRLIYAHSKNPDEMWCSLLEKAYAKLCGCYEALESGSPSDALVDLTGTVPDTIDLEEGEIIRKMGEREFVNMLRMTSKRGALMSCSINVLEGENQRERLPNGLVVGHSYGITDIQIIKIGMLKRNNEIVLVRLHNPWGEVEWNGPWSDKAPEWNIIDKSKRDKLGFKIADDGDFWMSFRDFITNFSTLIICRRLNTSLFSLEKRWRGMAFRGEWSVENVTAGGCVNNPETFYQNPQYSIRVSKPTELVISLMQRDHRSEIGVENVTIGFVCFKVEENRKYRIHKSTYEIVGRVKYVDAREVTTKISLKRGHYILIPSTFNIGEEGEFFMRLFSSRSASIYLLTKDAPQKKWYYPIVYFRKSYFVGMVRAKIVGVNLTRELSKGYIRVTFSDLKGRTKHSIISPKFDSSLDPDVEMEYVFYVRDPSNAKLTFHLHESETFGSDKMLGETGILLGRYSRHGKEGRIWEITKTLTRVIKVPPYRRTVRNGEREVPGDNMVDVSRRFEPATGTKRATSSEALHEENDENDEDDENDEGDDEHALRKLPEGRIIVVTAGMRQAKNKTLVPMVVDAGIGELQIRITYYQGVNA